MTRRTHATPPPEPPGPGLTWQRVTLDLIDEKIEEDKARVRSEFLSFCRECGVTITDADGPCVDAKLAPAYEAIEQRWNEYRQDLKHVRDAEIRRRSSAHRGGRGR